MSAIILEIQEDDVDGGFVAKALGHDIITEGGTLEELREMVKKAMHCHISDEALVHMPKATLMASSDIIDLSCKSFFRSLKRKSNEDSFLS